MDGVEGWLEAESLALVFEGFQKSLNPGGGKDIENLLDLGGIGGDLPSAATIYQSTSMRLVRVDGRSIR